MGRGTGGKEVVEVAAAATIIMSTRGDGTATTTRWMWLSVDTFEPQPAARSGRSGKMPETGTQIDYKL